MKLAVILFNLGGPDSPESVEPFLRNLFSDPAIIALPAILRLPLARLIASRRAPVARAIYDQIGGRSPIFAETRAQADALEQALSGDGVEARAFVAMRCWHPFSDGAARAVKDFNPDKIVLLPLYPQYSTTTTASSLKDWARAARAARLEAPTSRVCCYPWDGGFVAAAAAKIGDAMADARSDISWRLLLSAHGLPKRTIQKGDPYQWQVEQSAAAIVKALDIPGLETVVCYQSRVGPLEWIGPSTDAEIHRAGADGKGVIVAPIAFVSEHSETLVELDIEYRKMAAEAGVPDYRRAATMSVYPDFIASLAGLVRRAQDGENVTCGEGRICPALFKRCGYGNMDALRDTLSNYIPWFMALHIIAVVAWMAGMLYLPRLFVYHTETVPGAADYERFTRMERKLLRGIMNPAMIAVWILGPLLAWLTGAYLDPWLHIKFALVIVMTALHGFFARCWKDFNAGRNSRSARFYRIINEVPAVLMVLIVILVKVQPFSG